MSSGPSLFLQEHTPYLIVAPKYNHKSAGIRALHLLCHSLNLLGYPAYIAIYPQVIWDDRRFLTCPELCTPLATPHLLRWFKERGRSPIAVYPEVVSGNPLHAATVVRWLLNYPGLLGGDTVFDASEIIYGYSKRLAESVHLGEDRVLFLPTSDPNIFFPPPPDTKRQGSCFYAAKYQHNHHGELMPVTANSIEITRDLPGSQSKQQIAELFRRSEVFYTYEDTALVLEAGLCGCPTVFIPNPYLSRPLGLDDIGTDGFAWGDAPEEIARAKATVCNVPENYHAQIERYWQQLQGFIEHTQQQVAGRAQVEITLPSTLRRHMYLSTFRRYGLKKFIIRLRDEICKRGLGTMMLNTFRNVAGSCADRLR